MSRYRGNAEQCPHCQLTYKRFTTGLTYEAVYEMLMDHSTDPADWKYKRRGTVLGKWHQMKKELWQLHKDEQCEQLPANLQAMEQSTCHVPF